jgi:FtsH-binding integral membrane protein
MNTITYAGLQAVNLTRIQFSRVTGTSPRPPACWRSAAYAGRDLGYGVAVVSYLLAFVSLIGMRFAVGRSAGLSVALLFGFGLLMGLGLSPTLVYDAGADPQALWQAGAATALFVAGFGAAGYATRRDLSALARLGFWALLALIVFGIVLIFVHSPGGALVYSVMGLVVFSGLTMVDFQRLHRSRDLDSAPLIGASIFLDALYVFLFFLQIFVRKEDGRVIPTGRAG